MANFIDEILDKLRELSEEYCDEDPDESKWNSGDYHLETLKENYIN